MVRSASLVPSPNKLVLADHVGWWVARDIAPQLLPRPVVVGEIAIRGVEIVSSMLVQPVGVQGTIPSAAIDLFNYLESLEQSVSKLVVVPLTLDSTCHYPGCNP